MLPPWIVTEPVHLADVSPGQMKPDSEIGNVCVLGVSDLVALLHVAPTDMLDVVIVQCPRNGAAKVMTKLPFVTSTAVVLVAVRVQGELDTTNTTLAGGTLVVQPENDGPAGVDVLGSVVKASTPPADRTPEW